MEVLYAIIFFLTPLPFIILSAFAPYLSLAINILLGWALYEWWGRKEAIGFVLGVSLFSWVAGCLMHYSFQAAKIIIISIILGALGTGLFFFTAGKSYLYEIRKYFDQAVVDSIAYYRQHGVEEEKIAFLQDVIKRVNRTVIIGFPAMLIISVTAFVSFNYFLARRFLTKLGRKHISFLPPSQWRIPDNLIWVFIAAFFFIWMGNNFAIEAVHHIGLNFMVLMFAAYLMQGFVLVNFFLKKRQYPPLLKGAAYLLLLFQPILLIAIFLWGIFDVWFDFRKLEAAGGRIRKAGSGG